MERFPRFLPPLCSSCGTSREFHISALCTRNHPFLNRVICVAPYTGGLRRAIQKLKYRHPGNLGKVLGEFMLKHLRSLGDAKRPDVVIPVPLHLKREEIRGYNQAALLAFHVASGLGLPLMTTGLFRRRDTFPQWRLSRKQRAANIKGAFVSHHHFSGEYVLLVDDIITTSCTANECARVLRKAGVRGVDVFTLARDLVLEKGRGPCVQDSAG